MYMTAEFSMGKCTYTWKETFENTVTFEGSQEKKSMRETVRSVRNTTAKSVEKNFMKLKKREV